MGRGFVLRDCRCDQGQIRCNKLVRRKTVVGTTFAVDVPQFADLRVVKEEAHPFFPRLPDTVGDVSTLVEKLLFRTEIEGADKQIPLGVPYLTLGRTAPHAAQA